MKAGAIVVALAISLVGVVIFARAVRTIIGVVKLGRPIPGRRDQPGQRWKHLLAETLGHTRMLQWNTIGAAHWFVFVAFGALFFTLLTAYGQLFDPRFALPVIGHWVPYEAASELIAWAGLGSILYLITVRVLSPNRRRTSRFFGSRSWQAYYVEFTILGIVLCVLALRALEYQLLGAQTSRLHFPTTWFLLPVPLPVPVVETAIVVISSVKIIISMAWFIVIGLHSTMGVAWHRFTAWPNIWFKRESSGRPALGAVPPMMADGKPLDFADIENFDEDAALGVGRDRGLHLEGPSGLHLLHRVWTLPIPVPGLAYQQAAVTEVGDHAAAGARVREGAVSAGGRGHTCFPATGGPGRGTAPTGRSDQDRRGAGGGDRP